MRNPKTNNHVYGLAATDRPHISSDHTAHRRTHTRTPTTKPKHTAPKTQNNHPRARTRRTILNSPKP